MLENSNAVIHVARGSIGGAVASEFAREGAKVAGGPSAVLPHAAAPSRGKSGTTSQPRACEVRTVERSVFEPEMYIFWNSPEPSCKEEDMSVSSLIDVHHHVIPPEVRARLANHGVTEVGGVPVPRWDEARELEVLDRHRITTAVVSLSDTGQAAAEAKLVRLIAREANEFYAGLVARYPRRFGAFAASRCRTWKPR